MVEQEPREINGNVGDLADLANVASTVPSNDQWRMGRVNQQLIIRL